MLRLCQKAGLVKFAHIALDGTKVQANASKHKAMSYGRKEKKAAELEQEVAALLAQAEESDINEDALYGKGNRGDQLPEELRFKQARLQKIQEAKRALEEEMRAAAYTYLIADKRNGIFLLKVHPNDTQTKLKRIRS